MNGHIAQGPWRPKSYPAQTWTKEDARSQSTLSQEPEQPLKLPSTIRAVQDSRARYTRGRTLIICLDGTGDKFDSDNSNVVNFVACLKKDDPSQVTYYQSGIGTYDGHGMSKGFSAGIDMAVGSGLGVHIKDAYKFLMQNYHEGDKICLLGFSRGSYTVRCLAGMLHKVGLLPAHNVAQINFAYEFYKNDTPEGWKMSGEFKKTFCINVEVYFVGVWDCVAAVGFIPRKLPFSKSPTNTIGYFRHAMSLDEHRAKFKVCQYQHQDPAADVRQTVDKTPKAKIKAEKNKGVGRLGRLFSSCFGSEPSTASDSGVEKRLSGSSTSSNNHLQKLEQDLKNLDEKKDFELDKLMLEFDKINHSGHKHRQTDALEVWFMGCHADVGGGAVANEERHMLSRIPLRWMIRQCFECNTGILFDTAPLAETGMDLPTVWPVYKTPKPPVVGPSPAMVEQYENGALPPLHRRSTALGVHKKEKKADDVDIVDELKTARVDKYWEDEKRRLEVDLDLLPEQVEDHFDAMARINDQLVDAKGWWILEAWPVKVRLQKKSTEEWEKVVRMNLGRYRAIRELEPKMHWTVQLRQTDKGYKIQNRVDKDAVWQIAA
ncbi:Uncharacterized protein LSUE1_G002515 [Lachnellula suecica]|uniref:T6SS Phospholipase effector Tle1-like catalytic domain-containing protein n=1 Tax=Lachnellula suecica TaxID=602035 RepID=A0A8T9C9J5_9HELO|nr:Uncharacterized protein LSUE1_G002515 [Lachnellula suecica]